MDSLTLNDYQRRATRTSTYPNVGENFVYPAMGVAGEGGECCDKAKKYWRNNDSLDPINLTSEQQVAIIKEMGDTLWYLAALASELDITLEDVAKLNLEKLNDRKERGVLKSEGDNR